MNRPNVKDFFADIEQAHNAYLSQPELFRYTQALDNYIDYLEANQEQSPPPVVSHSCASGNSVEQDGDLRKAMLQLKGLYDDENYFDDDEDGFEPCSNCDMPDACADFGCAIKIGVRKDHPIDGVF